MPRSKGVPLEVESIPVGDRARALRDQLELPPEPLLALDEIETSAEDPLAVLVFAREAVPAADAVGGIRRRGEPVVLGHLEPGELADFAPIPAVEIPAGPAYSLRDVDLGADSRNVPPEAALRTILERGRSPLTLEEGIAVMLQQPEAIAKNWGFSMAGSRRNDQRVPAFWVSEGRPKLGWCWDRNPHTWLGTASCAERR